jgi:hypothetical protein
MTMERMHEHLTRADSELEAVQRFLELRLLSSDEAQMALEVAIANARVLVGSALATMRRLEEAERG